MVGKRGRPKRDYGIAPRAIEFAHGIIARSAHARSVSDLSAKIKTACTAKRIAPPSRATINSYVRRNRAGAPAAGAKRVVIGRSWFHLPVKDRPADAMPTCFWQCSCPRVESSPIVSTDPFAPPSVSELVAEAVAFSKPGEPARAMIIDTDDRRAADAIMRAAGLGAVKGQRQSVQKEPS